MIRDLPTELFTAEQTRQLDQKIISDQGLSGWALMQAAGSYAFDVLRFCWPRARRIVVVCGPGNNGGDGYVLARCAHITGLHVVAMFVLDPAGLEGDANTAWQQLLADGGKAIAFDKQQLTACDVIVDGLFGTGLGRELADEWLAVVGSINAAKPPVLSLDIPSGLHANIGDVLGAAIKAKTTVCFVGLNVGLFTGRAADYRGEIYYSGLGISADNYNSITPAASRLCLHNVAGVLPLRKRSAHKQQCGRVLVVGGAPGLVGAVSMTAMAAYRSGSGVVKLLTHESHARQLDVQLSEVMVSSLEAGMKLREQARTVDVIAFGPGLGHSRWASALFHSLLETQVPIVLDADGLNLLARDPVKRNNWILTPHPGEAARLLGLTTGQVQKDRLMAARSIVAQYGGVCVLKGAGTIVTNNGGNPPDICDVANAAMAAAGMGDILTGVIAALVAQGMALPVAARTGVYLHAAAGEAVADHIGQRGMIATDLISELPVQLDRLQGSDAG